MMETSLVCVDKNTKKMVSTNPMLLQVKATKARQESFSTIEDIKNAMVALKEHVNP